LAILSSSVLRFHRAIHRDRHFPPAAHPPTASVAREIDDDLVQPGRKLAVAAKFTDASVNFHKRVLGNLGGIFVIEQQRIGNVKRSFAVSYHQCIKCRLIACSATCHQFAVGNLRRGL
jgi:hypothetical protein